MFLLVESHEHTYAVHESLYESKKDCRTPKQWGEWFQKYAFKGHAKEGPIQDHIGIIRGTILPGMNLRTNKQWWVVGGERRINFKTRGYLGFQTHDLRKPQRAKTHKKRRKAKPSRK